MDENITKAIMYGDHPPFGVYFTVKVEYSPLSDTSVVKESVGEESIPLESFPVALNTTDEILNSLITTFGEGIEVEEMDPEAYDGFHLCVYDTQSKPLARIGIDMHDNRNKTYH